MRWLADELNEADVNGDHPYLEGNVYICRNCATEMSQRKSLCVSCARAKRRETYHNRCRADRHAEQIAEEEFRC